MTEASDTLEHARSLGHDFVTTIALQTLPILYAHMGEVEEPALLGEWLEASLRMGNPVYIGLATAVESWVRAARGDAAAVDVIRSVRERLVSEGAGVVVPWLSSLEADALRTGPSPTGSHFSTA